MSHRVKEFKTIKRLLNKLQWRLLAGNWLIHPQVANHCTTKLHRLVRKHIFFVEWWCYILCSKINVSQLSWLTISKITVRRSDCHDCSLSPWYNRSKLILIEWDWFKSINYHKAPGHGFLSLFLGDFTLGVPVFYRRRTLSIESIDKHPKTTK